MPLASQCDYGTKTFTLPAPIASVYWKSDNSNFAIHTADQTRIHAGSVRPLRLNTLASSASNLISPVGIGRIPLVVTESNTNHYWGVNTKADFVPLLLPGTPNQVVTGQEVVMIEQGGSVHVFGHWLSAWTSAPVTGPVQIVPGRALIVAQDGTSRLLGFSWLTASTPVVLQLGPGKTAAYVAGTGESDTRRNAQVFVTDTNELSIFSAYLDRWVKVTTTSPAATVGVAFDKNVIRIDDPVANEILCFSDITGTTARVTVANLANTTLATQDFGIAITDSTTNILYLFRAIDGGLAVLPGGATSVVTGGAFTNNLWCVARKDAVTQATEYHACASSVRGAPFVPAGASGQTIVAGAGNDNTFVLTTNQDLFGFSAFTNHWTKLSGYQGTYVGGDGEDFIGWVETSSHVYVFSPREDRWVARTKGPGFVKVSDSDQVVIVDEGATKIAFGTESTDFQVKSLSGAKVKEGQSNTYHFSIHDNATTGGSTIHLFAGFADRWIQLETQNRLTATTVVHQLEDSIFVEDGDKLHVLTAFGDLTSQWGAPNDNYAWHAIPNANARFFATGVANAPAALVLGLDRTSLNLPGICAPLKVGGSSLLAVPIGSYDQNGALRFDVVLPPSTGVIRLQMASLASSSVQLGSLLNFEIY